MTSHGSASAPSPAAVPTARHGLCKKGANAAPLALSQREREQKILREGQTLHPDQSEHGSLTPLPRLRLGRRRKPGEVGERLALQAACRVRVAWKLSNTNLAQGRIIRGE